MDDESFLAAGYGGFVCYFNMRVSSKTFKIKADSYMYKGLSLLDKNILLTGGNDKIIKMWDLSNNF